MFDSLGYFRSQAHWVAVFEASSHAERQRCRDSVLKTKAFFI